MAGPELLSTSAHLRHHQRFYTSLAVGALAWILAGMAAPPIHLALAGDIFFGIYIVLMFRMGQTATVDDLRQRASFEDEGIIIIVLITLAAITLSFGAIFFVVNASDKPDALQLVLLLLSVPLGWTTLHTIMAFHYAHRFYRRHPFEPQADTGGLQFPGTPEPGMGDFLYYSFVVGMTAQVSDVQVVNTSMRRLTLAHGVVAFFFNAVIVALAVNVALGASR